MCTHNNAYKPETSDPGRQKDDLKMGCNKTICNEVSICDNRETPVCCLSGTLVILTALSVGSTISILGPTILFQNVTSFGPSLMVKNNSALFKVSLFMFIYKKKINPFHYLVSNTLPILPIQLLSKWLFHTVNFVLFLPFTRGEFVKCYYIKTSIDRF